MSLKGFKVMEQLFLCDTQRENQMLKSKNNKTRRPSIAIRSTSCDELLDYRYKNNKQYIADVEYGPQFRSYHYYQVGINQYFEVNELELSEELFFIPKTFSQILFLIVIYFCKI